MNDAAKRPRFSPSASGAHQLNVITSHGFEDYELLDSGGGRKLERFGKIIVDRPEQQALWQPEKDAGEWEQAHAFYAARDGEEPSGPGGKGKWQITRPVPDSWPVRVDDIRMLCRLQGLWHLGLFPEQAPHWAWVRQQLNEMRVQQSKNMQRLRVLNLFAYTGAASLIAASAGAEVTHVDASKKAISWAKDNQAASGLEEAPIRWILDDAQKFVAREVRRKRRYDMILVDPPKFGRGPSGQTWELFEHLPGLLENCKTLLGGDDPDDARGALVLTVYAIRASAFAFDQLCRQTFFELGGSFESGELIVAPRDGGQGIPTSLFTRWRR